MPASGPRTDSDAVGRLADVPAKLATLLESERWPPERLRSWQLDRLDELLAGARAIPSWAERIGSYGPGELEDLPILERHELQVLDTGLAARDRGPVIEWRTSGTSGRPVRVLHGPEVVGYGAAARLRQQTRFGLPAAPLAEAGFEVKVGPDAPPVRAVGEQPPKFLLSHLAVDEDTLEEVHQTLLGAGGVRLIGAWPSMVEPWARLYEQQSDLDARDLGVRLCALGAEIASAEQRRRIAQVFGCEVGELYGQREVPVIACECRHGSLHVEQERVILEIVGPRGEPLGAGATGEIVATLLHSHEMPLIRYRTGDVGTLLEGPCPCGLGLERLDLRIGRLEDTVMRSDGRLVQSRFVRAIYEQELGSELLAHRTTQTGPAAFSVTLELRGEAPTTLDAALAASFGAYLGEPVAIDLTLSEIEPSPAGRKQRTFTRSWRI